MIRALLLDRRLLLRLSLTGSGTGATGWTAQASSGFHFDTCNVLARRSTLRYRQQQYLTGRCFEQYTGRHHRPPQDGQYLRTTGPTTVGACHSHTCRDDCDPVRACHRPHRTNLISRRGHLVRCGFGSCPALALPCLAIPCSYFVA
jgi:hypothetical protein